MVIKRRTKSSACTKNYIIERVAERFVVPDKKATSTIETLLEIMKSALASGEDVMVPNFGKFEVKYKAERKGRNPATGKSVIVHDFHSETFTILKSDDPILKSR